MKQLLISLTFLILASVSALAETPTAMITSVNGSAMVIFHGHEVPAEPMMAISAKTLIELRPGSNMSVVFFAPGSTERFTGPVLFGVGKNRSKVFKGAESARQVVGTNSSLIKSIDPNALGEGPGNGKLSASSSGGKTTISWQSTAPGPYIVSIIKPAQDGAARTSVWGEEVAATNLLYTGPKLDPGITYVAEVQAGGSKVAVSPFRVVDGSAQAVVDAQAEADAMKTADPTDTTPNILMHTLYGQMGQSDNAIVALRPAIAGRSNEDAFVTRLNVMGAAVNRVANEDTAGMQAFYSAEENWTFAPYWNADSWGWNGWDD